MAGVNAEIVLPTLLFAIAALIVQADRLPPSVPSIDTSQAARTESSIAELAEEEEAKSEVSDPDSTDNEAIGDTVIVDGKIGNLTFAYSDGTYKVDFADGSSKKGVKTSEMKKQFDSKGMASDDAILDQTDGESSSSPLKNATVKQGISTDDAIRVLDKEELQDQTDGESSNSSLKNATVQEGISTDDAVREMDKEELQDQTDGELKEELHDQMKGESLSSPLKNATVQEGISTDDAVRELDKEELQDQMNGESSSSPVKNATVQEVLDQLAELSKDLTGADNSAEAATQAAQKWKQGSLQAILNHGPELTAAAREVGQSLKQAHKRIESEVVGVSTADGGQGTASEILKTAGKQGEDSNESLKLEH